MGTTWRAIVAPWTVSMSPATASVVVTLVLIVISETCPMMVPLSIITVGAGATVGSISASAWTAVVSPRGTTASMVVLSADGRFSA